MSKREVVDAKGEFRFWIRESHAVKARDEVARLRRLYSEEEVRKYVGCLCVVRQAIEEALSVWGATFEGAEVGTRIVKIYASGKETRFATPEAIRRAVVVFTETLEWPLEPGEYVLIPPPPSQRVDYVRPKRKTKTTRRSNPSPTRRPPYRKITGTGKLPAEELPAFAPSEK